MVGQWLKGHVYERRSDLSPDGKRWIYFAIDGKWDSRTRGSYTAIAQTPYLKAVALWAKGDCWDGGGLFIDNDTYCLNGNWGHQPLLLPPNLQQAPHYLDDYSFGHECLGVYYPRLLRDGWTLVKRAADDPTHPIFHFEKPTGMGWLLRKLAHATNVHPPGKGCYYDEHELVQPLSGKTIPCPSWEWADVDRNRLVWSEGGRLFAAQVSEEAIGPPKELYDFNPMSFAPITAPY